MHNYFMYISKYIVCIYKTITFQSTINIIGDEKQVGHWLHNLLPLCHTVGATMKNPTLRLY